MKSKRMFVTVVLALGLLSFVIGYSDALRTAAANATQPTGTSHPNLITADDPTPPTETVKLIFIHHSTGGHWLADSTNNHPYGELGTTLMNNNYFVSATNYGWGPDSIGDRTDIPNWPEWFTGPNRDTYMNALYNESGQNFGAYAAWARLPADPGGENTIIMFKSCFPNSDLYGAPNDPPYPDPNAEFSVSNAKAVYNNILTYFATRQDKLFIVITAPPLTESSYPVGSQPPSERAANARAFNNWLRNDWLASYPYSNVAIFDYYNVLTSNGGDPNTNDLAAATGNHHRWWNGAVQHLQTVLSNYAAYPSGDSHPSTAGHQKAAAEFVQLLNVYYHRWQDSGTSCTALAGADITGPTSGYTDTLYTFAAQVTPTNATTPITYTWEPEPASGQGSPSASYTWAVTGTHTITLTAENCGGSAITSHDITIATPFVCAYPLESADVTGPNNGYTDTLYSFNAAVVPTSATAPITYTWEPEPASGQGSPSANYTWAVTDTHTITLTAENCGGSATTSHDINITGPFVPSHFVYLPLVMYNHTPTPVSKQQTTPSQTLVLYR